MRTEASVEVDRPIGEVFDYTNNHVADWSLTVIENEVLEEKPGGVGTTFRTLTEDHGRRMEFQGVVTRHEPPTASAVNLKGPSFDIDAEYFFEDLAGRTRVTQRSIVHGKGFFKLMLGLCGWMMKSSARKAVEAELGNLKRLLEEGKGAAAS